MPRAKSGLDPFLLTPTMVVSKLMTCACSGAAAPNKPIKTHAPKIHLNNFISPACFFALHVSAK